MRNISLNVRANVVVAADLDPQRRSAIGRQYPQVAIEPDAEDVIEDGEVDAVVIATPISSHHDIAMRALKNGKHVLVAKPMASSSGEAEAMTSLAEELGLQVLVDHTFLYTGAVECMKRLIDAGDLGDIYYFDSVRVNLGLVQPDVNVVWDLAAHDFAILRYLFDALPTEVQAVAAKRAGRSFEDVAYVSAFFDDGMIAHLHVNWLSPVKVRMTLVGGSRKMLAWDDLASDEKIKVYDRGIDVSDEDREGVYQKLVAYRMGDIWIPQLERQEALAKEVDHFIDCIEGHDTPRTGAGFGTEIVRLLEATDRSILEGGTRVPVR